MPSTNADDLADVRATLAGDGEAYARIIARHASVIQRRMRHFSRDDRIHDELVQEVFAEAYMSLHTFRGDAPFQNWLVRIGTFHGRKYWRKRDRQLRTVSPNTISEMPEHAPEIQNDPAVAAQLLFDLLATLSEDDRLIMSMMYLEGCSQDKIAEQLGYTRVAIAVRIHRAKKKLQKIGEQEPWKGRISWILS